MARVRLAGPPAVRGQLIEGLALIAAHMPHSRPRPPCRAQGLHSTRRCPCKGAEVSRLPGVGGVPHIWVPTLHLGRVQTLPLLGPHARRATSQRTQRASRTLTLGSYGKSLAPPDAQRSGTRGMGSPRPTHTPHAIVQHKCISHWWGATTKQQYQRAGDSIYKQRTCKKARKDEGESPPLCSY